ncbi:pyridoxine 5'-phosphate synthase [Rhodovibrionaceae bacterium A322]
MLAKDTSTLRLGVNIDHVATIRNARGGQHPDPVKAAVLAQQAGADGITAHLREDRRHISDRDIERLMAEIELPLNFEMAATDEMLSIALRHRPHAACIVPEKREEVTTEGGLDVIGNFDALKPVIARLNDNGSRVSLFVDPDPAQLEASHAIGAPVVEIHSGAYCEAFLEDQGGPQSSAELARIVTAAAKAEELGLECHAGHGLTFDTVGPVAAIESIVELNIGHFLIGEAIFSGLDSSIRRMRALMERSRLEAVGQKTA